MPKLKLDPAILEHLQEHDLLPFSEACTKVSSRLKSGQNHWIQFEEIEKIRISIATTVIHLLKRSYEDVARTLILVKDADVANEYLELFNKFGSHTDLRVWTAYEGPKILRQKEDIYFGADVVIATPKRLHKLLNIEGFNSAGLLHLLLDEADQLLKVGVNSFTHRISDSVPEKQRICFSTCNAKGVRNYMDKFAFPFYSEIV